jgi:hypothetical protein
MILLFTGCNGTRNQETSPSGNAAQNAPAATPEIPLPQLDHEFIVNDALEQETVMESYRKDQLNTAQSMAQLYVEAIKKGLDLAKDEDATEMSDLLFNRQTLAASNLRPADYMPDSY